MSAYSPQSFRWFLALLASLALAASITPGKLADITVLSNNLLEIAPAEILQTEVLYTIVDGKIVYERDAVVR